MCEKGERGMIGRVVDYNGATLTIKAPYNDTQGFIKKNITACEIRLDDGRSISADQRKKIYAVLKDISLYTGYVPDEIKAVMKYEYIARTGCDYFSLSDTDMTTANGFLEFLIEWCVEQDIPCGDLLEKSPDVSRYLYCCLANKKCCLCGKKADLHHTEAIGMGRNRKEIAHIGIPAESLCRHHHGEAHLSQAAFDAKYHIYGIRIDENIAKIHKLKGQIK
jgi:hypothetical protein